MMNHKLARLVAFSIALLATTLAEAKAAPDEEGVCANWCVSTGGGPSCPDEQGLIDMCNDAGCKGSLPGCAEEFNCPDGYRIQCNSSQE